MMEPVAWMDDGTTRTGSETTGFRVVHANTKTTMPRASSENFTVALVRLSDAEARIAYLTRELAEARYKALEEAAKVVEALPLAKVEVLTASAPQNPNEYGTMETGALVQRASSAAAIRALKASP